MYTGLSKSFRIMMALLVFALTLFTNHPVQAVGEKIGLVTTALGVADMSFNYMAYQGLLDAEADFGVVGTLYEPATSADYETELQQCVIDGNELCFAVGFEMETAVWNVASANPGTAFAILDLSFDAPPANLRGILFNEKQVGYLAGALAGKMTSSGVIGVVGGAEIRPVIAFVEGYRNGAQCSGTKPNVLINYTGTFSDPNVGAAAAETMINKGADVVFGAASVTGNGAILYSAQHGVWSIGVDTDQYISLFESGAVPGSDKLLTSAMKRLDQAVYKTIEDYLNGAFTSGTVIYDLANEGVGLAPYHETEDDIPQGTKDYVDGIKQGILAGTINIDDPCKVTKKFTSIALQDGWILESAENSNQGGALNHTSTTFYLGDNAQKKQYRSVLSFNTKGLPDNADIVKVILKVKKQGVAGGGNPVNLFQGFRVDIKKGFFGSVPGLQVSDFQASASKSYGPVKPDLAGGWYAINLTAAKASINKLSTGAGVTQIRLRFKLDDNNNALANYLSLYSGNAAAASRPQLIIEYYVP